MQYQVYVEFTSPKGKWFPVFSWLVRLAEGTPYSHVRLRWESTVGEELIYEASGSSVKLIGRHAQDKHQVVVHHSYKFLLTIEQYKKMIGLFKYAGVSYGSVQILGITIAKIFGLSKNPFADGKYTQICSELVGRFLVDVLGKYVGMDLDSATPRTIKEHLDANL